MGTPSRCGGALRPVAVPVEVNWPARKGHLWLEKRFRPEPVRGQARRGGSLSSDRLLGGSKYPSGWRLLLYAAGDARAGHGDCSNEDSQVLRRCRTFEARHEMMDLHPFRQRTFRQRASIDGVGLHSGAKVRLTLAPAPPYAGIVRRVCDWTHVHGRA